jgi:hypothetical protein
MDDIAELEGTLKSQFESDFIEVFAEITEFARTMTFEIADGQVGVVWDTEILKERAVVQQMGVYLGDVLLFIAKRWFSSEPQPEEVIYEIRQLAHREVKVGWRILDIVDVEKVYEVSLSRLTTIS